MSLSVNVMKYQLWTKYFYRQSEKLLALICLGRDSVSWSVWRSSLLRFVGDLLRLYSLSEHLTIISLIWHFGIHYHYYFSYVNIQEKLFFYIIPIKYSDLIMKEWKTSDQTRINFQDFPDNSNPTLSSKNCFPSG